MAVELHVEPRRVMTWAEFKKEKGPYSIALDGFVNAPTRRFRKGSRSGPYANFDHHTGVDRMATSATCAQVYMEIISGLFDTFQKDGLPHANVYINDPDEDTCLSWWELKNHERVVANGNELLKLLIDKEDLLDRTAGAFPMGNTGMRRKMAWIFEPYNNARFHERLPDMSAEEMRTLVEAVEARIDKYMMGDAEQLALEGHYERIGGGKDWVMTRETGPASRMAMYADGFDSFVALVGQKEYWPQGEGVGEPIPAFVYSYGTRSDWTGLNVPKVCRGLNKLEEKLFGPGFITPDNQHGGSTTIGGSPRRTGSLLEPERMQEAVVEINGS